MENLRKQMDILHKQYTKADLVQIRENQEKEIEEAKQKQIETFVNNVVRHILEHAKHYTSLSITHYMYSNDGYNYPLNEDVVEQLKIRFPDSKITLERNKQHDLVIIVDWS